MSSELVVDVQPKEISIALLEDKALVEFQKEGRSASFNVGNMYLGRVRKLMPGLNACFVDVGFDDVTALDVLCYTLQHSVYALVFGLRRNHLHTFSYRQSRG